ncbi:unnamed protein product [Oncorhynchus mykiss]|uniref:Transglutaminase C-terminal domain-containing protein n=1 Tax=Oncorhynchus mykiss TaxID=8022 RepID=A0A060VUF4_ONCMY|nr:unnamed protein product [Oncorhynchus mykiss]
MPLVNRGDAVKVCRIGSAMMNSQDDRGVLVGNWSDDYSLGTAPTFWIGSDQILLQYVTKGPVSFAQCWVYAGTFNTCECLIKFPFHFQCPPHNIGHVSSKLPVNSDVYKYKLNSQTGKTELLSVDTTYVGMKILTKSIGETNEPMDITETYKYPEGSSKDEETMRNAERTYKTHLQYDDEQGVAMTLEIPQERVKIGQNFQMAVVFRNLSEDTRTIHGFLVGSTIYYTNIQRAQFKQLTFDVTLKPMESESQYHHLHVDS